MLFLILTACLLGVTHAICPMMPTVDQSWAKRTSGDGGYKILVSEQLNGYIPNEIYTITLQGSPMLHGLKRFRRFTLTMHSQDFPTILSAPVGHFQLHHDSLTAFNKKCIHTVSETTDYEKFDIQVKWRAPMAGSGCVVFTAMVLENSTRWYAEDGALTKTVCEAKTEIVNAYEPKKLKVAENTEDRSKQSLHGWKQSINRWLTLVDLAQLEIFNGAPTQRVRAMALATEKCFAEREPGPCKDHTLRWYFNPQRLKCEQFWYGGCQGNQNNFQTAHVCNKVCDIVRVGLTGQVSDKTVTKTVNRILPSVPTYIPSILHPVDCVVTGWSNWSPCSVTCGVGLVTSYRTIEREAANGGHPCPKMLHRYYRCELAPCE